MKKQEILELMQSFNDMQLSKMEYEYEGERIVFEKQSPLPTAIFSEPATQNLTMPSIASDSIPKADMLTEPQKKLNEITSPLVGVFYHAPSPKDAPFVSIGEKVSKGQILCLIEAMKMISELPSPFDGIIKNITVKNEDVVSFGQILFEVEPC